MIIVQHIEKDDFGLEVKKLVRASNEDAAFRLARRWCMELGMRRCNQELIESELEEYMKVSDGINTVLIFDTNA